MDFHPGPITSPLWALLFGTVNAWFVCRSVLHPSHVLSCITTGNYVFQTLFFSGWVGSVNRKTGGWRTGGWEEGRSQAVSPPSSPHLCFLTSPIVGCISSFPPFIIPYPTRQPPLYSSWKIALEASGSIMWHYPAVFPALEMVAASRFAVFWVASLSPVGSSISHIPILCVKFLLFERLRVFPVSQLDHDWQILSINGFYAYPIFSKGMKGETHRSEESMNSLWPGHCLCSSPGSLKYYWFPLGNTRPRLSAP